MPEDTLSKAAVLAKKIATHMSSVLACDGVNLVQNNGEAAGQTVFHYHLHIIPRYNNDGAHILWEPTKPEDEEQKALCERLKMK